MIDLVDMIEEIVDIQVHCRKQEILLDTMKCYRFFYHTHKEIFGSNSGLNHYEARMSNRYRYIIENTWDLVEEKIKRGQTKQSSIYLVA